MSNDDKWEEIQARIILAALDELDRMNWIGPRVDLATRDTPVSQENLPTEEVFDTFMKQRVA